MDARRLSLGLGIFSIALAFMVGRALGRGAGRASGAGRRRANAASQPATRSRQRFGHATTIEPEDMPFITAPGVTHH